ETRALAAGALSLIAAATLASCGPREPVVAQVGNRSITVSEFNDIAARAAGRYPGPPDAAKALLLQDLIRRDLLLEAATRRGLERDSLARRQREQVESEVLSSALVSQ